MCPARVLDDRAGESSAKGTGPILMSILTRNERKKEERERRERGRGPRGEKGEEDRESGEGTIIEKKER